MTGRTCSASVEKQCHQALCSALDHLLREAAVLYARASRGGHTTVMDRDVGRFLSAHLGRSPQAAGTPAPRGSTPRA